VFPCECTRHAVSKNSILNSVPCYTRVLVLWFMNCFFTATIFYHRGQNWHGNIASPISTSPKPIDCVKSTQLEIRRPRNLQNDRDIHCELHSRGIGNESRNHWFCRFYRIGEAKNPGPPNSDCRICVYNPTGMNNKHMFFLEHLQNGISWFQKQIDD